MKAIYEIRCILTNKIYVGSTLNHLKREKDHFNNLKKNKHHNKKLQNAYNKYGSEYFKFTIIEEVSDDENLIEREQHYIDTLEPFFNICKIANSSLGLKRSQETKDKIRDANLGIKHPRWRNEIKSKAQGGDKHWTKKKKFSNESKLKMSESQKELYKNGYEHWTKKRAQKGESIVSDETKLKISNTIKELYKNGYSSPHKKRILQLNLDGSIVREWESITQAANELGFNRSAIANCLLKKTKTSSKYKWVYVE